MNGGAATLISPTVGKRRRTEHPNEIIASSSAFLFSSRVPPLGAVLCNEVEEIG